MSVLEEYNEKRNFNNTPEPSGKSAEPEEKNRFVIQRHMARREHYDFRLQVGDVLVSWAIPKKPVYDPEVKRLAIKVEDHPLDYIHFEGNIPKGNYGAGSVMVWDIGYYYLDNSREVPKKGEMIKRIAKGSLKLYLQGVKLKGSFNLVKSGDNDKEEWFFMKSKTTEVDDYEERSVLTGRDMEEIAASKKEWLPEEEEKVPEAAKAGKKDFPGFIKPMLATLTDEAFSKDDWIYELKLDGYRILGAKNKDDISLFSRNGNLYTEKYSLIAEELAGINADFIADGEVCFINEEKMADFQKLQNFNNQQENLHYYVFDLLWLNGYELQNLSLTERKKILKVLLKKAPPHIHYLDHVEKNGEAFFAEMEKQEQEGMIAKRAESAYYPGERSKDWLKVKTSHRQEMIICGYTHSEKESRAFSSLLCAVYEGKDLIYTGRVGTGFNASLQKEIMGKLKKLETKNVTVKNPPDKKNIQWTKPALICEVQFSSWTDEGIMRHPSFIGLRSDKKPVEIRLEKAVEAEKAVSKVEFTNLDKIFWPEEGITKEDVIEYYRNISRFILPYLKDRPQSLYRTPNGVTEKGFFQKNVKGLTPEWTETTDVKSSKGGEIQYLLCQDEDTLLYMANLGCIEINPWSSSLPELEQPDYLIFDLDPVDVEFERVTELALEFKKLFDQLSLPAYCKTSGGRGLHIYIPVKKGYSYKQTQNFVKTIETHIHKKFPKITSMERSPSARKGMVYLDYLQNGRGKTMASVYSLRPRPGALVSAPLAWEELKPSLKPEQFNIFNMQKRLEKTGDLWKGFFNNRVGLGT